MHTDGLELRSGIELNSPSVVVLSSGQDISPQRVAFSLGGTRRILVVVEGSSVFVGSRRISAPLEGWVNWTDVQVPRVT